MSVDVHTSDLAEFLVAVRAAASAGEPLDLQIGSARYRLPDGLADAVVGLVDAASSGDVVDVAALPPELTTGQAADLLGVSRPTVVTMVDRGELAAHRIGTHRRLRTADVLAYRERARRQRAAALDDLAAASQELGLYDGA